MWGDTRWDYALGVSCDEAFAGRLSWTLTIDRRTLGRGDLAVAAAPDKPAQVTLPLPIPPVKPGVVLEARLSISVTDNNGRDVQAMFEEAIRIFPRDPFHLRIEWLESLQIALFDPAGETARAFDAAEVPYRQIHNPAALKSLEEGLLIVGEGVSLKERPSLAEALVHTARRGVSVLCLAPADGVWDLPQRRDDLLAPQSTTFRRQDVIAELDKQLDADGWPNDGRVVTRGLELTTKSGRVVLQVTDAGSAWPWWETHFPARGTLLVCGFGIIEHWEAGPTPRFLLARLFERLSTETDEKTTPPEQQN